MEQDYLKRLIEETGRVLGKILVEIMGLKKQGRVGEIYEITDQILRSELDFNIDDLMANENVIRFLVNERSFSRENMEMLADILYIMGSEAPEEDQKRLLAKCLAIDEYLQENSTTFSIGIQQKIRAIKNILGVIIVIRTIRYIM